MFAQKPRTLELNPRCPEDSEQKKGQAIQGESQKLNRVVAMGKKI